MGGAGEHGVRQELITVRLRTVQPLTANTRNLNRWLKEGLERALAYWHQKFLPLHFTTYAYSRYPNVYKRRKGGGKRRYRRGGGEWRSTADARPLYETGYTRNLALSSYRLSGASIGGGKTTLGRALLSVGAPTAGMIGARITFNVPHYIAFLRGKGFDPDAELTTVNAVEMSEMGRVAFTHVSRRHREALSIGPSVLALGDYVSQVSGTARGALRAAA